MNEYLKYLLDCINKEDCLLGSVNFHRELLNVCDYRNLPYNLICTVRTTDKQILAEYNDKYAPAGWKTRTRRYYSVYSLIRDIKRVINIKELKGDNNMGKLRVESINCELNTGCLGSQTSDYTIRVNVDGFYPGLEEAMRRNLESLNNAVIYSGRGCGKTRAYYGDIATLDYATGGFTTWRNEYQKERDKFDIRDVIFNNPATIVLWEDGTKTVVKAENEEFDPEKGLAMAIAKKALGNNYDYYDIFKKYVGRYEKKQKKGDK